MGRMHMAAAGLLMAALTTGCAGMNQDGMSAEAGSMGSESMGSGAMASGSAHASGGMNHSGMQMSAADHQVMTQCMAMSREAMMRNARCAEMARMHPEMTRPPSNAPR